MKNLDSVGADYAVGDFAKVATSNKNTNINLNLSSLVKKRIEILSGGDEGTNLMKMIDISDYKIADTIPLPDSKVNELAWYRKTAYILGSLFRNSEVPLS